MARYRTTTEPVTTTAVVLTGPPGAGRSSERPLLQHARGLARSMPDLIGIDIRVDTDDRAPDDVALVI